VEKQAQLLEQIKSEIHLTQHQTGISKLSSEVIEAIVTTPREQFVLPEHREQAYLDEPLSIGLGQTISQPFIVALMTELLQVRKSHRVLEIGTGSGYQLAILAKLAKEVIGVEVILKLADAARNRLQTLDIQNAQVIHRDGNDGYIEKAPYDRIMVSAAAAQIPPELLRQLRPNGRLVIPLGEVGHTQTLTLVTPKENGFAIKPVLPVRFVPLVNVD
jgi:protein-L-isoaspartate(D-aspartate) O-methyltransferase